MQDVTSTFGLSALVAQMIIFSYVYVYTDLVLVFISPFNITINSMGLYE